MKTLIAPLAVILAFTLSSARAQEKAPAEQAQKIAAKILEMAGDVAAPQIKVRPDASQACLLKAGEMGALVIPDQDFTAEKIAKAGKDVVPVGQLYFKGLAPAKDGLALAESALRIVTVADKGTDYRLPLLLLGVRKQGEKLELVLFGRDKAPVLAVALKQAEASQETPIELSAEKRADESADFTLNIAGKYRASFAIKKSDG
ncbi:MAG: hypothetical protein HZA89_11825 [Verrucomicrobia bacterium]|nr:hypothetical protein [Verrucomicrobiota bacterium]